MMPAVDIVQSLEAMREKVIKKLQSVREYRALLAVEKAIAEISDLPDIVASLEAIRVRVKDGLEGNLEYRALCKVENAITDIVTVAELIGDTIAEPLPDETDTASAPYSTSNEVPVTDTFTDENAFPQPEDSSVTISAETAPISPNLHSSVTESQPVASEHAGAPYAVPSGFAPQTDAVPDSEKHLSSEADPGFMVSDLAYNVAHSLVHSLPTNATRDKEAFSEVAWGAAASNQPPLSEEDTSRAKEAAA